MTIQEIEKNGHIFKLFGFFPELGLALRVQDKTAFKEYASKDQQRNKDKLMNYIRNGWVVMSEFDGHHPDVLSDNHEDIGSFNFLTDGIWIWPGKIGYYIEKYNIVVPDDFVATMENNNWEVPKISNELADSAISVFDASYPKLDIEALEAQDVV